MAVDTSKIERIMLHLGQVRTVDTADGERPVSLSEASLDRRILRALLRAGGATSGSRLRQIAGARSYNAQDVDQSLARLFKWDLVTLEVGKTRRSIDATLTPLGFELAQKCADAANKQAKAEMEFTLEK